MLSKLSSILLRKTEAYAFEVVLLRKTLRRGKFG